MSLGSKFRVFFQPQVKKENIWKWKLVYLPPYSQDSKNDYHFQKFSSHTKNKICCRKVNWESVNLKGVRKKKSNWREKSAISPLPGNSGLVHINCFPVFRLDCWLHSLLSMISINRFRFKIIWKNSPEFCVCKKGHLDVERLFAICDSPFLNALQVKAEAKITT